MFFFPFALKGWTCKRVGFMALDFCFFDVFYRVGKVATPVSCRFLYDRHELYSVYLCAGMMGMITLFL